MKKQIPYSVTLIALSVMSFVMGCSNSNTPPEIVIPTYDVTYMLDQTSYSKSKNLGLNFQVDGVDVTGPVGKLKEGQTVTVTAMEGDAIADSTYTTFDFSESSAANTAKRKGVYQTKVGKDNLVIKVKAKDITTLMITEMTTGGWFFIDKTNGDLKYRFRPVDTSNGPYTYVSAGWYNKSIGRLQFISMLRTCSMPAPIPTPDADGLHRYEARLDNNFSESFTGLGGSAPTTDGLKVAFITKAFATNTLGILEINNDGLPVPNRTGSPLNIITQLAPGSSLKLITKPLGFASGINGDEYIAGDDMTSASLVSVNTLKYTGDGYTITKNEGYVVNGNIIPFNYSQIRSILKTSDGKHYCTVEVSGRFGEAQYFASLDHSVKSVRIISQLTNGFYGALIELPLHTVR
ncbi:MAG: hypothetical protein IM613_15520 [Cytophagales bacterium]|nr:hypothetical protein [Cytophagales bacterium]